MVLQKQEVLASFDQTYTTRRIATHGEMIWVPSLGNQFNVDDERCTTTPVIGSEDHQGQGCDASCKGTCSRERVVTLGVPLGNWIVLPCNRISTRGPRQLANKSLDCSKQVSEVPYVLDERLQLFGTCVCVCVSECVRMRVVLVSSMSPWVFFFLTSLFC